MVPLSPMRAHHWSAVAAIYEAGIASGMATFETASPTWERFDATHLPAHRYVALAPDGAVQGWVAVAATSHRAVYAGVVEHSLYVAPAARGRGVGRALLTALIDSTEAAGIWTLQAGVFPENAASLALHRALGFRVVGTRERVAQMAVGAWAGHWRDVVLLERRSTVAGA